MNGIIGTADMSNHFRVPLLEVQKYVPQCDVFVDCGPAKPKTEAWMAKELWPDARIIGFEPWPEHYEELRKCYPGWLYPYAVGHCHSTTRFGYLGPNNAGRFTDNDHTVRDVPMVQLNHFLWEHWSEKQRIVLWADVEGSEADVLHGASFIKFAAMALETRDTPHCEGWPTWKQLEVTLDVQGYKVVAAWTPDPNADVRTILAVPK